MTYAVISDIHCHGHSLFARTDPDGVNSRLRLTLNEMERAATELVAAGGHTMVIAGDILHSRGVIDPEVLNPLRTTIERIIDMGVTIYAIPGNHDLKSAETNELASSIQNLQQVGLTGGAFQVFNAVSYIGHVDGNLAFVPWRNTQEALMKDLADLAARPGIQLDQTDVFIHAGIDGVLSGMPAHGLTHTKLASFGFRRVFAGHYHNHKDFGNSVFSIGATTHHNWGDVGTRAGFLLVDDTSVKFRTSQAPSFIDISGMSEDDMLLTVPGNYVRFRGPAMTKEQVEELRTALRTMGALGVSVEVPLTGSVLRSTAPKASAMTTEQSIEAFVTAVPPVSTRITAEQVTRRAIEVLHESQAVTT